jgi:hypothetical protein
LRKDPENGCNMFIVSVKPYLPDNTQFVVPLPDGPVLSDLYIEEIEKDRNKM